MTRLARLLTLAAVVTLIAGLPLPPAAHAQKAFKMGAIVPIRSLIVGIVDQYE